MTIKETSINRNAIIGDVWSLTHSWLDPLRTHDEDTRIRRGPRWQRAYHDTSANMYRLGTASTTFRKARRGIVHIGSSLQLEFDHSNSNPPPSPTPHFPTSRRSASISFVGLQYSTISAAIEIGMTLPSKHEKILAARSCTLHTLRKTWMLAVSLTCTIISAPNMNYYRYKRCGCNGGNARSKEGARKRGALDTLEPRTATPCYFLLSDDFPQVPPDKFRASVLETCLTTVPITMDMMP